MEAKVFPVAVSRTVSRLQALTIQNTHTHTEDEAHRTEAATVELVG